MRTGADWVKWIPHGISHCRVFVALLDAGSVRSGYMEREAALAEERHDKREIDMLGYQFPNLPNDDEDNWTNLLFKTAQKRKLTELETPERIAEIVVQEVTERLPLPDCRVAFLGNPDAGKASLIARLSGTVPEQAEGIHEILWTPEVKGRKIRLRCVNMNFNEKETKRELYRCFLTPDTVYVLVWDSTLINVDSESSIAEWLEVLNREVPGCPVLLVLNKADQCEHGLEGLDGSLLGLNGSSLEKANGALRKRKGDNYYFWSFSRGQLIGQLYKKQQECDACAKERNRDKFAKAKKERDKAAAHLAARLIEAEREETELIQRIVAEARNIRNKDADTGKPTPAEKRAQLEDSLSQTRLCCLSAQQYADACADIGFHEQEERNNILAYLRSVGAVWHDSRQTDSVFRMDSAWLAKKINALMDEAGTGFLPRSYDEEKRKLCEANAANGYDDPCQAAEFVFQIMQYYNLAFLLNHKEGKKVIVPYRLLDTPPEDWKRKMADMEESALHLRCEGIAVSPVALCKLMLELGKVGNLSRSSVWKYGFLLRQNDGECQALINTRISALYAVKTDNGVLFDASADSHVSDADDTDDNVMDVYVKGGEGQWPAGQWGFWTAIHEAIQPIVEEYSRGQWKIILYCRRKRSNAPDVIYTRCRLNDGDGEEAVVKCEIDYEEACHLEELRANARHSTQETGSRFFLNLFHSSSANDKEKLPKRISVHALSPNMPDGSMDLEQILE